MIFGQLNMGLGHFVNIPQKDEFKVGDIVIYRSYDLKFGRDEDKTPPIFKITKIDDLDRVWYGNDCVGIAYIRHANEWEEKWFKEITNPRKQKLLKINKL